MKTRIVYVAITCVLCVFTFACGLYTHVPTRCEDCEECVEYGDVLHITSIENGSIVHSKVWIDATFPEGTYEKSITINGTKVANYSPFLWNNINARAGKYHVRVAGKYKKHANNGTLIKNGTAEHNITIIIPEEEIFVGDRNNFTEAHVIHEGQCVIWANGTINFSRMEIVNGGDPYNLIYEDVDVFGNLTVINCSLVGFGKFSTRSSSATTFTSCSMDGTIKTCGKSRVNITDCQVFGLSLYGNSLVVVSNSSIQGTSIEDNSTVQIA